LGKVRERDLHLLSFIKVRFHSIESVAVEYASNTEVLTSRSNDYSKNAGINSDWKALLLNNVVVGKGKKLTQNDTSLTAPPKGYDSVRVFWLVSRWKH
jgi:hypothetical protein